MINGSRPLPGFLSAGTRPIGGAPTTYYAPPPPPALPGTLIDGGQAGSSALANLHALSVQVWHGLVNLFQQIAANLKQMLAR